MQKIKPGKVTDVQLDVIAQLTKRLSLTKHQYMRELESVKINPKKTTYQLSFSEANRLINSLMRTAENLT